MDFGNNVGAIVGVIAVAAILLYFLWLLVSMVIEIFQFSAGMHDLDLAYLISREDRKSLSKKEYNETKHMKYSELKAFLNEKFPNSIPEIRACMCDSAPKTKTCECD